MDKEKSGKSLLKSIWFLIYPSKNKDSFGYFGNFHDPSVHFLHFLAHVVINHPNLYDHQDIC